MPFIPLDPLLIESTEIEKNVTAQVMFEPEGIDELSGYEYTISPEPPKHVSITTTPDGVVFFAPHLIGFFEPIELKLIDRETNQFHHFKKWEDVPDGLTIVSFKPPVTPVTYTLTVTATVTPIDSLTMEEGDPIANTLAYQIVINPHYSAGQEALLNYGKRNS